MPGARRRGRPHGAHDGDDDDCDDYVFDNGCQVLVVVDGPLVLMTVMMMIVIMMIVTMMFLTQPTGARCGGRPHGALPWERRQALRPHTDAYCKFSQRSWSEPLKSQEIPRDMTFNVTPIDPTVQINRIHLILDNMYLANKHQLQPALRFL